MKIGKYFIQALLMISAILFMLLGMRQALAWPNKPITIIVPFTAGGSTDTVTRIVAENLSKRLGQPVIVDNRPGAGGTIGTAMGARAAPDGNTIVVATSSTMGVSPNLYKNLSYDPTTDFDPITLLGKATILLALHPSVPANTVQELIAEMKKRPGEMTFASGGVGSISHLVGEYFKLAAGVDMLHVPYKGDTEMLADLVGGRISLAFGTGVAYLPYVKRGQLKAIAVADAQRTKLVPDLPTIDEAGVPGFNAIQYFGLLAPAGTPDYIIQRLQKESNEILNLPNVKEKMVALGLEVVGSTPTEFSLLLKDDYAKWGKIIKASGTTINSK